MKKQQKLKQEKKPKNKQPLTFDERFKDKINVIGKLGVLDLLGLHQPFNMDRQPTPILEDHVVESSDKQKNPEKEISPKRRHSYSQIQKPRAKDTNFQSNKTDSLKKSAERDQNKQKLGLPRISKSMANIIQADLGKKDPISTKQYWRGKNNMSNKKRANSQLSCFSMMKIDFQANAHFQNMVRFEKINKGRSNKKNLKIEKL